MYSAHNGALVESAVKVSPQDHFQVEINRFVESIRTGEKLPSHIDYVISNSKIIQAIYDSSEQSREIVF